MVTVPNSPHAGHAARLKAELSKQKLFPNFFLEISSTTFPPYMSCMFYMATPKTAQSRSRYMARNCTIDNRLCCMAIAVPPCSNCGAWFLHGDLVMISALLLKSLSLKIDSTK